MFYRLHISDDRTSIAFLVYQLETVLSLRGGVKCGFTEVRNFHGEMDGLCLS